MKSQRRKSTFFFLSIHLLTCVYIWVLCPLNFPYSKYLCRVCHLNEPLGYWREEKTSGSKSICSVTDASLTSDSGGWAWNCPVTLAGWSSSCSWLSFSLSPGLGVSSAYPEYMGYICWHSVHFLLLCDIIASYYFSFFVLFLTVQKNAYVWYYFLCRVVSVRVFWRKSYELEWLGCGACGGVTSFPADLPPSLIILCVFATCIRTHRPHSFVVTCTSLYHSFIVMS